MFGFRKKEIYHLYAYFSADKNGDPYPCRHIRIESRKLLRFYWHFYFNKMKSENPMVISINVYRQIIRPRKGPIDQLIGARWTEGYNWAVIDRHFPPSQEYAEVWSE